MPSPQALDDRIQPGRLVSHSFLDQNRKGSSSVRWGPLAVGPSQLQNHKRNAIQKIHTREVPSKSSSGIATRRLTLSPPTRALCVVPLCEAEFGRRWRKTVLAVTSSFPGPHASSCRCDTKGSFVDNNKRQVRGIVERVNFDCQRKASRNKAGFWKGLSKHLSPTVKQSH